MCHNRIVAAKAGKSGGNELQATVEDIVKKPHCVFRFGQMEPEGRTLVSRHSSTEHDTPSTERMMAFFDEHAITHIRSQMVILKTARELIANRAAEYATRDTDTLLYYKQLQRLKKVFLHNDVALSKTSDMDGGKHHATYRFAALRGITAAARTSARNLYLYRQNRISADKMIFIQTNFVRMQTKWLC
jgi:hypothetical protein